VSTSRLAISFGTGNYFPESVLHL